MCLCVCVRACACVRVCVCLIVCVSENESCENSVSPVSPSVSKETHKMT